MAGQLYEALAGAGGLALEQYNTNRKLDIERNKLAELARASRVEHDLAYRADARQQQLQDIAVDGAHLKSLMIALQGVDDTKSDASARRIGMLTYAASKIPSYSAALGLRPGSLRRAQVDKSGNLMVDGRVLDEKLLTTKFMEVASLFGAFAVNPELRQFADSVRVASAERGQTGTASVSSGTTPSNPTRDQLITALTNYAEERSNAPAQTNDLLRSDGARKGSGYLPLNYQNYDKPNASYSLLRSVVGEDISYSGMEGARHSFSANFSDNPLRFLDKSYSQLTEFDAEIKAITNALAGNDALLSSEDEPVAVRIEAQRKRLDKLKTQRERLLRSVAKRERFVLTEAQKAANDLRAQAQQESDPAVRRSISAHADVIDRVLRANNVEPSAEAPPAEAPPAEAPPAEAPSVEASPVDTTMTNPDILQSQRQGNNTTLTPRLIDILTEAMTSNGGRIANPKKALIAYVSLQRKLGLKPDNATIKEIASGLVPGEAALIEARAKFMKSWVDAAKTGNDAGQKKMEERAKQAELMLTGLATEMVMEPGRMELLFGDGHEVDISNNDQVEHYIRLVKAEILQITRRLGQDAANHRLDPSNPYLSDPRAWASWLSYIKQNLKRHKETSAGWWGNNPSSNTKYNSVPSLQTNTQ